MLRAPPPARTLGYVCAQGAGALLPPGRRELRTRRTRRERCCRAMEQLKVEKFRTADRGNGLRAVVPLRPGELLLRSDPLAYTVCKGSRGVVCDHCLLGKEKLMRCSQCQVAKYCSAKCQKKAWQDHKRECKCLKSCKPRYPPDSVRLLGRVVFKLMEETPSESEKLYSFYDLESNINKLTEDKKEGLRQLVMTFQHFMKEEIQDASQLPLSFNIFEAFAKLTICYLDILMTSVERQKQLRDQYCFECNCGRCQTQDKDADMLAGDEQVWKEVQESLKKIEELKAQWKWEEVLAMCQTIISSNSERLPDINIYQLKVLDCAMDACINLGLLEEALFYGIRTMEPYRMFFPGSHPVRGVQVMKVGKLQLHQGMFPQAMKNLRLAFDIMRVTHGREHSLTEDLILLLEECDANIRAS
ncbi:histone-lysine N-methyltransferase SMYD3 isoform X2 [Manis pentadactyla]|uniref:histone-lysine N-methyltransferase SMYD3 isoform X2 n=1 Tax=Manis pentadactyla TaxID=143292 RepID=UPI00255CB3C9|nr:histone-lysine N-methyltransferase SMYD3 isoform X2 [Manis pentadactyla]